jgi:hypothetical protein
VPNGGKPSSRFQTSIASKHKGNKKGLRMYAEALMQACLTIAHAVSNRLRQRERACAGQAR